VFLNSFSLIAYRSVNDFPMSLPQTATRRPWWWRG